MTATPARIGFILNQYRRVIAERPDMKARHGALARESEDPIETDFDDLAHAELMAEERADLLSAERLRLSFNTNDALAAFDMNYHGGVPVVQMVDTQRRIDRPGLIAEITFDLGNDSAAYLVWG
jgi:hypothetical protein